MLIKGEEPAHNLDEETEGLTETKIEEVVDGEDDEDDIPEVVDTALQGNITEEERRRAGKRRDELAQKMWDDYLEYIGRFED